MSRLLEGRLAWGRTILLTRDTANLLTEYIYPVNKELGLLAIRHLSIFGYLLKSRLREEVSSSARKTAATRKRDVGVVGTGQSGADLGKIKQILPSLRVYLV